MIASRLLRVARPCCYGRFIFRALDALPTETYERRCRRCETTYLVRRTTRRAHGIIIDRLDYLDTKGHDYTRKYGEAV